MERGPVLKVLLYVTENIFTDTTGVDVDASMDAYADILEEQFEKQLSDYVLDCEIRIQHWDPGTSIDILATDSKVEHDLYAEIVLLEQDILSGKYGDWIVEAKHV